MAELPRCSAHPAEVDSPAEPPVTQRLCNRRYLDRLAHDRENRARTHDRSARPPCGLFVGGEAGQRPVVCLLVQVAVRLCYNIIPGHVDEALVGIVAAGEGLVELGFT